MTTLRRVCHLLIAITLVLSAVSDPCAGELKKGERSSVGFKPLTEMTAQDRYKGEDGGLYGGGKNEPPAAQLAAAKRASLGIVPRDAHGKPATDGKIVLLSIGMSNTAAAFFMFKEVADRDPLKSPQVILVNGAIGGAGAASSAKGASGVWAKHAEKLKEAEVTPEQVQVVWLKHAEPFPEADTAPLEHAKKLHAYLVSIVAHAKSRYPNLRVIYLSSRIYGGYNAAGPRLVNPEPFAYESAFSVRWTIQDQIKGTSKLDPDKGPVAAPVLLWGPYLWADGVNPRKSDGLTWRREDLGQDGVHASKIGGKKSAEMLLRFFKTDDVTRTWFVKK